MSDDRSHYYYYYCKSVGVAMTKQAWLARQKKLETSEVNEVNTCACNCRIGKTEI